MNGKGGKRMETVPPHKRIDPFFPGSCSDLEKNIEKTSRGKRWNQPRTLLSSQKNKKKIPGVPWSLQRGAIPTGVTNFPLGTSRQRRYWKEKNKQCANDKRGGKGSR